MKKLFFVFVLLMVSLMMTSQTDTTKMSNYEKYVIAKESGHVEKTAVKVDPETPEIDDLYFQPYKERQKIKDKNKKDTIEKKVVIVKNYYFYETNPYFYSNCISRFHHRGFNYWYYRDLYFYDDYYFGWGYPHFSRYYTWNYHYDYYYGYNHYNYYNRGYYNSYQTINIKTPQQNRRVSPSNYTQTYTPNTRRVESSEGQRNRIETSQQRTNPRTITPYSESRREYTPSYETPRTSVRPQYNNTRVSTPQRTNSVSSNVPNSRRVITAPSSRTYDTQPYRQVSPPSRSVSEPSRNFNSGGDVNRGSMGSSVSSGSIDRRSVSSGSNNAGLSNTSRTTGNSGNNNTGRR